MTVPPRELGPSRLISHSSHFGRRAMHTRRPCRISVCENHVHLSRGTSAIKSRSIFTGSFSVVRPSSVVSRCTWVSTTIPSFLPNQVRSEEHTSELQSRLHLVCRLLLEKKKKKKKESLSENIKEKNSTLVRRT